MSTIDLRTPITGAELMTVEAMTIDGAPHAECAESKVDVIVVGKDIAGNQTCLTTVGAIV
jgi:hypothetical protein